MQKTADVCKSQKLAELESFLKMYESMRLSILKAPIDDELKAKNLKRCDSEMEIVQKKINRLNSKNQKGNRNMKKIEKAGRSAVKQKTPETAEEFFERGNAHDDRGDLDKAVEDYNNAIRLKPDDADAY